MAPIVRKGTPEPSASLNPHFVLPKFQNVTHKPIQIEINHRIKDLGLTKENCEVLVLRLKWWNFIESHVRVNVHRDR